MAVHTDEQREWLQAILRFRSVHHGRYPEIPDILRIAWELGYRKVAEPETPDPKNCPIRQ